MGYWLNWVCEDCEHEWAEKLGEVTRCPACRSKNIYESEDQE
jgi:predicted Zn-ribbon and HTH transcriptional regulator